MLFHFQIITFSKLLPNPYVSLAGIAHTTFVVQTIYGYNTWSEQMSGSDVEIMVWQPHTIPMEKENEILFHIIGK